MTPPRRATPIRETEAGVTLVEVLVALVLFALIGTAGFSVLDQVIRVQARTDDRLGRLAEMQRTMHIVTLDFMQASGGSLSFADDAVSFRRGAGVGEIAVRYGLEDTTLVRRVSGSLGAAPAGQRLLSGVSAIRWGFLTSEGDWSETWPPRAQTAPANPAAVSLDLALAGQGLSGDLRRVAVLPAEAEAGP